MNLQQPLPMASSARPVWPLVIEEAKACLAGPVVDLLLADMAERHAFGIAQYKVALAAHNGRDHLVDSYQETLDQTAYLRNEIEEGDPSGVASELYPQALSMALRLREALERRALSLEAVRGGLISVGYPAVEDDEMAAFRAIRLGDLDLDDGARGNLADAIEDTLAVDLDAGSFDCSTLGDLATLVERALAQKATNAISSGDAAGCGASR